LDFARPFRFVFEDPDWQRKIAIGAMFTILSFLLVGAFFVAGYLVYVARNVMRGESRPLPEWDGRYGEYFSEGLKVAAIVFLYILPLVLIWVVLAGGMAALGFLGDEEVAAAGGLAVGCVGAIIALLGIVISLILPAALIMYAASGSISAAFNFREIFGFIADHVLNYVLAYIIHLVANFLSQFGILLLCIGLFFAIFWANLVSAYAFADAYRIAKRS
jgi:uncharacterized protein DUF4013